MKRPTKRRAQTRADAVAIRWNPAHEKIFALAGDGWTRPKTVAVRVSADGRRWTLEGRFQMADGHPVILRSRLQRLKDGSFHIAEQTMSLQFLATGEQINA